jgi:hypothetical protein
MKSPNFAAHFDFIGRLKKPGEVRMSEIRCQVQLEPVYAVDHEVIPSGTEVFGKITAFERGNVETCIPLFSAETSRPYANR